MVKRLINKMDFEALEVKLKKCKVCIRTLLDGVLKCIRTLLDGVLKCIRTLLDGVLKCIRTLLDGVLKYIRTLLDGVLKYIRTLLDGVLKHHCCRSCSTYWLIRNMRVWSKGVWLQSQVWLLSYKQVHIYTCVAPVLYM